MIRQFKRSSFTNCLPSFLASHVRILRSAGGLSSRAGAALAGQRLHPRSSSCGVMETPMNISAWRKQYLNAERPVLAESSLPVREPFGLFDEWFRDVASRKDELSFEEINAVALSTSTADGRPSSRMVLLKGYGKEGFTFFTNYGSRKGAQLASNPNGAMLFYWPRVHRQVRIEGVVDRLPPSAADEYWASRPIGSRISGAASPQSRVVPNREHLLARKAELETAVAEQGETAVARPENWGGFVLRPGYFEFWQGQPNRLHDRLVFDRHPPAGEEVEEADDGWHLYRLAP